MANLRLAALTLPFLLLAACSDTTSTEKAKEPEKPPEPVTGRQAFQSMFPSARAWALDAAPLQLRSIDLPQVKSANGKAGAWEATFVSTSTGLSKLYTYSTVEAEGNLHKGVFAGQQASYSGPTGSAIPFAIAAIKFDSDQAYQTAVAKSADYIKKNPNKHVMFLLSQSNRFPDLTWRIFWGDSISTSDYSVFVDATTGKFLDKVR
jgi:hypothetical protein